MYKAKVEEQIFEFEFSDEKALKGTVNGAAFEMDFARQGSVCHVLHNNSSYAIELVRLNKKEKTCVLKVNNQEITVSVEDRFDALLHQLGMGSLNNQKINEVKSPMPGLVLNIMVQPGDSVSKGDSLIVLEAMKMENIIKSPADGVLKTVEVEKSSAIEKNQVLITFD